MIKRMIERWHIANSLWYARPNPEVHTDNKADRITYIYANETQEHKTIRYMHNTDVLLNTSIFSKIKRFISYNGTK